MEQGKVLDALSAMAHETRLAILRMLVTAGPEGLSAGRIGAAVAAPASRLSFHLATLERAGLVASRRSARHVIYRARTETIGKVMGYLLHNCCAGTAGRAAAGAGPDAAAGTADPGVQGAGVQGAGAAAGAGPSGMVKI